MAQCIAKALHLWVLIDLAASKSGQLPRCYLAGQALIVKVWPQ